VDCCCVVRAENRLTGDRPAKNFLKVFHVGKDGELGKHGGVIFLAK
jgi:hypothetical protein